MRRIDSLDYIALRKFPSTKVQSGGKKKSNVNDSLLYLAHYDALLDTGDNGKIHHENGYARLIIFFFLCFVIHSLRIFFSMNFRYGFFSHDCKNLPIH